MSQARKTLLLWLALVAMFVAIYALMSPTGERPGSGAGRSPRVWLYVAIPVVVVGLVLWVRRANAKNAALREGIELLAKGRSAEALQKFEGWRKSMPGQPAGPYNVGVARLTLWQLEEARREFEAGLALNQKKDAGLAALAPEHLALTDALLGRLASSRTWLTQVPTGKGDLGRVALTEAILHFREGNPAAAEAKLAVYEVKQLSGTLGAFARALRAFCAEALVGELRHVDKVGLFAESGPERLKAAWPEFIAFVERAPAE